jgi:four helix bundle protein
MKKSPKLQKNKNPNKLKSEKQKVYDLEDRASLFLKRVALLCKKIPLNARTSRCVSQIMGSAGSIGANYAEASEAMSKKDFIKSIKISRKEAKETKVWLNGLKVIVDFEDSEFEALVQEATEFVYIFTSILKNVDK